MQIFFFPGSHWSRATQGRAQGSDLSSLPPQPSVSLMSVHQGMNERGTDGPCHGWGVREQRLGSEQLCAGEAPTPQATFIMQISLQPAASQQGVGEG